MFSLPHPHDVPPCHEKLHGTLRMGASWLSAPPWRTWPHSVASMRTLQPSALQALSLFSSSFSPGDLYWWPHVRVIFCFQWYACPLCTTTHATLTILEPPRRPTPPLLSKHQHLISEFCLYSSLPHISYTVRISDIVVFIKIFDLYWNCFQSLNPKCAFHGPENAVNKSSTLFTCALLLHLS